MTKQTGSRLTLGKGTFVRLRPETRRWLAEQAKRDGDRSLSSLIRKIVEDAKATTEFGGRAA